VNQILLGTQISFGRLNRGVAQKQLDLLKLPAGGPAQFGACAPEVMRGYANDPGCFRILLQHLPDYFLGHAFALKPVAPIHGPEYAAVCQASRSGPSLDRKFHPSWYRHSANPAVLPHQIDDTLPIVALLDMREHQRRHFGSA
jgi:hypothetical protein